MSVKGFITVLLAGLLLSGCSILNPYEDSFQCPNSDDGLCVDLPTAYDIATGDVKVKEEKKGRRQVITLEKSTVGESTDEIHSEYRESLYTELKGLLDKPETPMIKPPKVMRILILPYNEEDGVLMMSRRVYKMMEDSKWVVGDYLTKAAKGF